MTAVLLVGSLASPVWAADYAANFKGTDIEEFINTVGRTLKKTIIIEPSVRGKINVRSYDELNEQQYYQFFLNVLDVYGFAVVEMPNNVMKVIKAKDAKGSAIPVVDDSDPGQGDEMVTRVVAVKNVSVRELSPLLRQLNDNAGGGNVVHYDPSNVLMITGRAAVVNRLVEIVRRVDKAGDQEVDIVRLKFATASEIVKVLESILGSSGDGKSSSSSQLKPKMVADERTNSVVVSGEPQVRQRIVALIAKLDSEMKTYGNTRVFYLKYANAKDLVEVLTGVSESKEAEGGAKAKKTSGGSGDSSLSIQAHEQTNSLVITAQPDTMRTLENVINQLDIRRAQVHVEAIIAEIAETDKESNSLFDFSNGLATVFTDDWYSIFDAVSTDAKSNLLATPSLTTMDNQEAFFIVGEEVPVVTGSSSSSSNDNPFTTVDRTEVGIKLKITPQINEGNSVQLAIEQEVSSLLGTTSVDVTFATRQLSTTVMVESGQIIVLAGLLDDQVQDGASKVPWLGNLPIFGRLFNSLSSSVVKRNLMIFIRPTILRDENTARKVTSRKYVQHRAWQLLSEEEGVLLQPDKNVPILREFDDVSETLSPEVQSYLDDITLNPTDLLKN
jgi:general secretion pathway protein D